MSILFSSSLCSYKSLSTSFWSQSTTNTNQERKHPNFQDSTHYHLSKSSLFLWLPGGDVISHEFNSGFNAVFLSSCENWFPFWKTDFTTEELIIIEA